MAYKDPSSCAGTQPAAGEGRTEPLLEMRDVSKSFVSDKTQAPALRNVSLSLGPGVFTAVQGRSGSGKTTLLNVCSTLLTPDSGRILYRGRDITALAPHELDRLRHEHFAVIFQFHHLLPYLTALENTLLPFMNRMRPVTAEEREAARQCLARVGLAGKEDRLPGRLSGEAKADYVNGVLTVTVHKAEDAKPRKIAING